MTDPPLGTQVRLLLAPDDLRTQFAKEKFQPPRRPQLGYDLRLGDQVWPITRGGKKVELSPDRPFFEVLPWETIVVATREVLNLDSNVFATGSPKMRLLIQGLWAHGGKTDFGFRGDLRLAFTNHGAAPIFLERDQEIFHITLWAVEQDGDVDHSYAGSAPDVEPSEPSPLGTSNAFQLPHSEAVFRRDGVAAFRAVRVEHMRRRLTRRVMAFLASVLVVVGPSSYILATMPDWLRSTDGLAILIPLGIALGTGVIGIWTVLARRIHGALLDGFPPAKATAHGPGGRGPATGGRQAYGREGGEETTDGGDAAVPAVPRR